MKRFALLALVVVAGALPAYAGIVIKKNGAAILGRIETDDVTSRSITVRLPNGRAVLDPGEVRWFDERADEPTDAYFDRFLNEPLEPRWEQHRKDYLERKAFTPVVPGTVAPRLAAIASSHRWGALEVSIRKPLGWSLSENGEGVVVIESPDRRARITFFASDVKGEPALKVARAALERLGTVFTATTETAKHREWATTLSRRSGTIQALRRIVPTASGTAFATGYADAKDWPKLASLIKESLDTFEAHEVK